MPVTISPQNPGNLVGPGLQVRLQTDLIGPLPVTTVWDLQINTPGDEQLVYKTRVQSQGNPTFITLQLPTAQTQSETLPSIALGEGANVSLNVNVQESGGGPASDSGSASATWSNTAGLTNMIKSQPSTGSGLTPAQAQDIAETHDATWPTFPVDTLTLTPVAGTPVGGTVSANLTTPVFGVIVRISSVPPDLAPSTADGLYWVTGLAVVRVYRGTDLWLRVPIHTESKLVNLWVEGLALGLADAVLNAGWLLNLTLQVTFREGVTGTVHLMRVP